MRSRSTEVPGPKGAELPHQSSCHLKVAQIDFNHPAADVLFPGCHDEGSQCRCSEAGHESRWANRFDVRDLKIFCREFFWNFTPGNGGCTVTQMETDTKECCRCGESSSLATNTSERGSRPAELAPTIKKGFINKSQGVKLPDERTMEDLERELEELKEEEKELFATFFNLYAEHQKMVLEYQGCRVHIEKMKPCAIKAAELLKQMAERCKLMDLDDPEPEGSQTPPPEDKKDVSLGGNM
jgi:hypothetical protein